jgi:hypothetical protein
VKGDATIGKLLKRGQKFCELNWKDAQAKVIAQPSVDQYCFRAPYVGALLRQGLHLCDDQVTIGSGDFAWTLGAALWEAGAKWSKLDSIFYAELLSHKEVFGGFVELEIVGSGKDALTMVRQLATKEVGNEAYELVIESFICLPSIL